MLVSFCKGDGCPLKTDCERFTRTELANHPKYIGFDYPIFVISPYNKESNQCSEIWKVINAN